MKNLLTLLSSNRFWIVTIVLLLLLPFYWIAFYNVSGAADDIYFANFLPEESNYFSRVHYSYNYYIGRYFNSLFFVMPNSIFMSNWFATWHPIVELSLLIGALYSVLAGSKIIGSKDLFFSTILLAVFYLLFMPETQTLYWFSGSTVYIFPLSAFLLFVTALLHAKNYTLSLKSWLVSLFLIVAVVGSNEILMVFTVIILLAYGVYQFSQLKSFDYKMLTMNVTAWIASYFVFTSPGTLRRKMGESAAHGEHHLTDVLSNFYSIGAQLLWEWFFEYGLILLPGFIFLLPISIRTEWKEKFKQYFPYSIMLSVILIIGAVFMLLYSLGMEREFLPRVQNLLFLIFLINAFGFGIYLKCLFSWRLQNPLHFVVVYVALSVFIFAQSSNITQVYQDLFNGVAQKAHQESVWRYNYLAENEESRVVLPRLSELPQTLMLPEWGDDENAWTNQHLAQFYKKESVVVNPKLTVEDFRMNRGEYGPIWEGNGYRFYYVTSTNNLIVRKLTGIVTHRFFLHSYSSLEKEEFDNFDFSWKDGGGSTQSIDLGDRVPVKMKIGQFELSSGQRIWSQSLNLNEGSQETSLQTELEQSGYKLLSNSMGFLIYQNPNDSTVLVEKLSGNAHFPFFFHIYRRQAEDGSPFINKDFNWPAGQSTVAIDVSGIDIEFIQLGQFRAQDGHKIWLSNIRLTGH